MTKQLINNINKDFWRKASKLVLVVGLLLISRSASAAPPPDFALSDIDTKQVRCGTTCESPVYVTIDNRGRTLHGNYSLQVDLRVTPGGQTSNARTYKQTVKVPGEGESIKVKFDDIRITRCGSGNSVFEANAVLIGGNYREGNKRNNKKKVTTQIRNRCKQGDNKKDDKTTSTKGNNPSDQTPSDKPKDKKSKKGDDDYNKKTRKRGPADYEVVSIETDKLACGSTCRRKNYVNVVIRNKGRSPGGGYKLQVLLDYTPGKNGARTKKFKTMIQAPRGGKTVKVRFENFNVQSCDTYNSIFVAKVNLLGGNYREGNKRNNQLKIAEVINNRCK